MPPAMLNRYARLERPIDHELAVALATASDRPAFYAAYDFEISPPTDDRPFFFHFFRPEQTSEVLENLGRRWQPFGGSVDVFPAPLGPRNPNDSPGATSKSIPSTAVISPNRLVRPRAWMSEAVESTDSDRSDMGGHGTSVACLRVPEARLERIERIERRAQRSGSG